MANGLRAISQVGARCDAQDHKVELEEQLADIGAVRSRKVGSSRGVRIPRRRLLRVVVVDDSLIVRVNLRHGCGEEGKTALDRMRAETGAHGRISQASIDRSTQALRP